jgi:hypothetical protein
MPPSLSVVHKSPSRLLLYGPALNAPLLLLLYGPALNAPFLLLLDGPGAVPADCVCHGALEKTIRAKQGKI